MSIPQPWQAEAYNQVPESENRIHSDEIARHHGFRGGLVPGVSARLRAIYRLRGS